MISISTVSPAWPLLASLALLLGATALAYAALLATIYVEVVPQNLACMAID